MMKRIIILTSNTLGLQIQGDKRYLRPAIVFACLDLQTSRLLQTNRMLLIICSQGHGLPAGRVLRNSGSVAKSVGQNWIQAVDFLLNRLSYTLFAVFPYLLSVRQKVAKNSAQNKISHNSLLLASRKRHPSVGCYLPLKAVRCHSGAPGLVRFSIINKKIMLPHFKHSSLYP